MLARASDAACRQLYVTSLVFLSGCWPRQIYHKYVPYVWSPTHLVILLRLLPIAILNQSSTNSPRDYPALKAWTTVNDSWGMAWKDWRYVEPNKTWYQLNLQNTFRTGRYQSYSLPIKLIVPQEAINTNYTAESLSRAWMREDITLRNVLWDSGTTYVHKNQTSVVSVV